MPKPLEPLKCSFCGKNQQDISKLIAGPGVYICNECIVLCVQVLQEDEVFPILPPAETIDIPEDATPLPHDAQQLLDTLLAGDWGEEVQLAVVKEYIRRVRLGMTALQTRLDELRYDEQMLLARLVTSERAGDTTADTK